jgi:hypothetical protein
LVEFGGLAVEERKTEILTLKNDRRLFGRSIEMQNKLPIGELVLLMTQLGERLGLMLLLPHPHLRKRSK